MIRLRDITPKGYWPRIALIAFLPIVAMMVGMTLYFFGGHMRSVNERLADAVARDTALIAMAHDRDPASTRETLDLFNDTQGEQLAILQNCPQEDDRATLRRRLPSVLAALDTQVTRPFEISMIGPRDDILLCLTSNEDTLVFTIPRKRAVIINGHIYIVWVLGFGILLLLTAFGFLRNQVRSILQLTEAAKSFGRGQDMPEYRPSGATEVRDAARAVIEMRRKLTAFADQRMAMLAGVSHDLRTPLTRLKLQMAMMEDSEDIQAARQDISHMGAMLDEYLAFARGEETEQASEVRLDQLVRDVVGRFDAEVSFGPMADVTVTGRRMALTRAISNIVSNAVHYGDKVRIELVDGPRAADLLVDDNGPGIPADQREAAFKPFQRLEEARTQNLPGSGLGLALARDTARAHGGDVRLETSPTGGLRARFRLPH
ncbi:MAG: ATP-binding protein [Hyphomonadaceae bacterium]|nr:ATP-binding protein [Hyphomonadaceae bacterium]